MTPREQRGLELATLAKKRFRKRGPLWLVPSASHNGTYVVDVEGDAPSCTCPDHEKTTAACKHVFAVEYYAQRTVAPDGTETVSEAVRATYTQNWRQYNNAQVNEKERLADLLHELCSGIAVPSQEGRPGRPCLPLPDVVFGLCMKVYGTSSSRRSMSDMRDLVAKGYMSKAAHFNHLSRYMAKPELTPLLKQLVEESAAPLKAVETEFAVDASGFSTRVYERWFDHKWGKFRSSAKWIKCHLMVGVKTNVVTCVEITPSEGPGTGDASNFLPLIEQTKRTFEVAEVSADKAYLSRKNVEGAAELGVVPYIMFKQNSVPGTPSELWNKLWHYFSFNREEFLGHYHKRSNVETTFSMIKGKFGASVRSKKFEAQVNEILLKILCHNLCRLVHAIYEFGLEPTFWGTEEDAS